MYKSMYKTEEKNLINSIVSISLNKTVTLKNVNLNLMTLKTGK